MEKKYEKLVAQYLAGNKEAGQALLVACNVDEELLNELAQQRIIHRLLDFHHKNEGSDIFTAELTNRLIKTSNDKIPHSVQQSIMHASNSHSWRFTLATALISILVFISIAIGVYFTVVKIDEPVATVDRVIGTMENNLLINENEIINQGPFDLSDGYAQVKLNNGVTLILEGPVNMTFQSDKAITINEGSVVATVPLANKNFTINTPTAQFTESGVEYAVTVDSQGDSQVHVLQGNVKAQGSNNNILSLSENQARTFDIKEQITTIKNNPEKYMRALPGKSSINTEYLHWSFDHKTNNQYACSGPGINKQCFPAIGRTLHHNNSLSTNSQGPEQINGQFGDGIYFNGENTWLETDFSGISGNAPRTVAFWVKVPKDFSKDHGYGILSWGLSHKQAAWQISPNPEKIDGPLGRIRVGSHDAEVIGTTDIRDGRWHHVAIVLYGGKDVDLSTHVLMYLDGNLEQSSKKSIARIYTLLQNPRSRPLMMGRNIGFEFDNEHKNKRFFKGYLDEVFIFNSALSQVQINQLMETNQITSQ
jgi:hypothetical protein